MKDSQTKIALGLFGKTKGLKGEIRLRLFNDDSKILLQVKALWVEGLDAPLAISQVKAYKHQWLIIFEDRLNINLVQDLVGKKIYLPRDQLPSLEAGEVYHIDLIGCHVKDKTGLGLGQVTQVLHTGANDILSIKLEDGQELLVPYIDQYICEIDMKHKTIIIVKPEVI